MVRNASVSLTLQTFQEEDNKTWSIRRWDEEKVKFTVVESGIPTEQRAEARIAILYAEFQAKNGKGEVKLKFKPKT